VTATGADGLSFQAIPETLRLTSLGTRRTGDRVNLERALRAGGRLDGHIVQGHIDATGTVTAIERAGDEVQMRVAVPFETARMLVHKGSVALDGVSLTVVEPDDAGFGVALIPHTLAVTTLGIRLAGDRVNVEVDVLGKYVFEYLRRREGAGSAGS
jgi:riboflavin synthase alpha subunit